MRYVVLVKPRFFIEYGSSFVLFEAKIARIMAAVRINSQVHFYFHVMDSMSDFYAWNSRHQSAGL